MKLSNVFALIAGIAIIGFYVYISTPSRNYVTKEEYARNIKESVRSLEAESYHLDKQLFDQPFNEIVLKDTGRAGQSLGIYYEIQWVQSETNGLKKSRRASAITNIAIENNKLICYLDHSRPYSTTTLVFYSPSLKQITAENARLVKLRHTLLDSLQIHSRATTFEMEETTSVRKLNVQADKNSNVTIKTGSVHTANYHLSGASTIRSYVDICGTLNIMGGQSDTAYVSLLKQTPNASDRHYGTVTYNSDIGKVAIEDIIPGEIRGNKDRLSLYMNVRQIQQALANIRQNKPGADFLR